MKKYCEMSREELLDLKKELDREFDEIKAEGLALDMSRGKPAPDQLDLSMKMMEVLAGDADLKCETGVDCRNYGVIDGIPEAKRLLGEMSEVEPENIIIYGNSSLNVMFDGFFPVKKLLFLCKWKFLLLLTPFSLIRFTTQRIRDAYTSHPVSSILCS